VFHFGFQSDEWSRYLILESRLIIVFGFELLKVATHSILSLAFAASIVCHCMLSMNAYTCAWKRRSCG